MASKEYYQTIVPFIKHAPDRPETIDVPLLRRMMSGVTKPAPGTATIHPVNAAGVPAEWMCGRNASSNRRLLYLHGGGYISGSAAVYREFTATLSNATGCIVLAPDYRLGPEHPFPTAVEDAVTAYGWMHENDQDGPRAARRTFIAGDSAGCALVRALPYAPTAFRATHHSFSTPC